MGVYFFVLVVEFRGNKFVVKLKVEDIEYEWLCMFLWVVGLLLLRGFFFFMRESWCEEDMLGWEEILEIVFLFCI